MVQLQFLPCIGSIQTTESHVICFVVVCSCMFCLMLHNVKSDLIDCFMITVMSFATMLLAFEYLLSLIAFPFANVTPEQVAALLKGENP